jgi:hypothetical protein
MMGLKTFRTVALGEFIPYEWLTKPLKEMLKSKESEEGDQSKEEKSNVLANMGVMLVILVVLIFVIALLVLCICLCKRCTKIQNLVKKVKAKIFWNSVLRFILQSYLKTTLGCLFAISLMSFGDKNKIINACMSIAMLIALVGFPFLFAVILHKNRGTLNIQEMKDKIGSLYLGMRTNTWIQRLYSSVFLFRRLMYCILTIVCIQQPNILIHVFLLTNIIYVTYLGYSDVNDTQLARQMEFFNEMGLQMIT